MDLNFGNHSVVKVLIWGNTEFLQAHSLFVDEIKGKVEDNRAKIFFCQIAKDLATQWEAPGWTKWSYKTELAFANP